MLLTSIFKNTNKTEDKNILIDYVWYVQAFQITSLRLDLFQYHIFHTKYKYYVVVVHVATSANRINFLPVGVPFPQNMNRYTNAIDLPPSIDRLPPGYTVFDLIQLSQDERVAYAPLPENYQPKVPLLPPPKRSPTQHSRYTSRSNREVSIELTLWQVFFRLDIFLNYTGCPERMQQLW